MDRDSDDNAGSHENHDSDEESSVVFTGLDDEDIFERDLPRVRNNNPRVASLDGWGTYHIVQNMTNLGWEDIGRDISNNTYLKELRIVEGALNDGRLSSLFRGLSGSSSIVELDLRSNNFNAARLRSLEPFLHNSTNLRWLDVSYNDIETEGFKNLWQALCDRPIERLDFSHCNITSIEIENVPTNLKSLRLSDNNVQTEGFTILMQVLRDSPIDNLDCKDCGITSIEIETAPKNLRFLDLSNNNIHSEGFNRLLQSLRESDVIVLECSNCDIESIEINTDSLPRKMGTLSLTSNRIDSNGCRGVAKLLQEGGITLVKLFLSDNLIDDEGVAIIVDALKSNTSLTYLDLEENDSISNNGRRMMLKLVNDISSIKATLQSNHTLQNIYFGAINDVIFQYINMATTTNRDYPVAAGREKVIQTQLHSQRRAELVAMQGVQRQSVYGEINPLHLPEVLLLIGRRHGQEELYVALKASIAEVMSTVNRKRCMQQRIAYHDSMIAKHESVIAEHRAKQRELREEIATMEGESLVLTEQRSTKRRRQ